jgi:hypothetical protein
MLAEIRPPFLDGLLGTTKEKLMAITCRKVASGRLSLISIV